ncbi:MAG TPA: branched-chain-amino-acid transaminase [Nitrospirota bacterium]|nr:branched-chain-amino-acid transaminase [Nitrospirota bacterium]
MFVYLDGRFIASDQAMVSVFDHGFLYGDGIYETMRAYEGRLFLLERHLARLKRSAQAISLRLPLSLEQIGNALNETLKVNELRNAYVRMHVSRGPGEIGLDPALCPAPTMVIVAKQFHEYPASYFEKGVRVALVQTRRNHPLALDPAIKGTNFLNNILAKIESLKKGAYEGIMLNWKGYIAEGTISNIAVVRRGILTTPHKDTGILAGVTREFIIRLAKRKKIPVRETLLLPKQLLSADECFITNTTMEIMPVTMVDKKRIGKGRPGPVTQLLTAEYRSEVATWLRKQAV